MSEKLRAAVIGTGMMGQHHVRVYREIASVQLVGFADADDVLRGGIAQRFQLMAMPTFVNSWMTPNPIW